MFASSALRNHDGERDGEHALLDSLNEAVFAFFDEANVLLHILWAAAADPADSAVIPSFVVQFLQFTSKLHGALPAPGEVFDEGLQVSFLSRTGHDFRHDL